MIRIPTCHYLVMNEAEEDEDVGMYVVPNTLTTRHGRQIRAVVRLDL